MLQIRFRSLALATLLAWMLAPHAIAQRWSEMDYGPFLSSTLEVDRDIVANKSIAIRLDEGEGGVSQGGAFVSFETDTLRYAAGWTGRGLMDWRSVVFDGSHGTHPSLVGTRLFVNPDLPGWANPADLSFDDTRLRGTDDRAYGPIDREWGKWQGLYRYGNQVVLSYRIGATQVLDMPGLEQGEGGPCITRTLQLGQRNCDMLLQVAQLRNCIPQLRRIREQGKELSLVVIAPDRQAAAIGDRQHEHFTFRGNEHFTVADADAFDLNSKDFTITALIRTRENGTIFAKTDPTGPWVADGKTFFVRNGKLCYDIGWVGDLESRQRVNDGQWHHVAVTFDSTSGTLRLYIDGAAQGERKLRPKFAVNGHAVRIGYTAANFPRPQSPFRGDMQSIQFFQRRLSERELRNPEVAGTDQLLASWAFARVQDGILTDVSGGQHNAKLTRGDGIPDSDGVAVTCVGISNPDWQVTDGGLLRLRIAEGHERLQLKLIFAPLDPDQELGPVGAAVIGSASPIDLSALTQGGPALWARDLETEITVLDGTDDDPFVAETLTIPQQNPWRSWMRLGGFDFFADGDRAAVCSWQGDVWLVQGLANRAGKLQWRRIASGLFQPLGLKVVDDQVYVLGRDQITRLHDLNGDGETDFYECFHNDMQVTPHFHEFAMDLQTDSQGNFYFMKAARHALPAVVPQHGTLIQVTSDGRQSRVLARGFRAPDGLLVNDDGTFISSDQEGHWTPMNRINWLRPGGFYGNMMAANPQHVAVDATDPPVCWIHRNVDRSPTAQVWVPRGHWGSLSGALLSLSYGTGKTFRVLYQDAGDLKQGGVVQLPIPEFPTGIQRGRFHPRDGMLYLCGLFGWSSDKTLSGGFYRVRHTGREVSTPTELAVFKTGIVLRFPQPLDGQSACEPSNFVVSRWNYRRTANYGSDDYRVSDGKRGRDRVAVASVSLSRDRTALFLHIPDMQTCMQMRIRYQLRAANDDLVTGSVDHTINALPDLDEAKRELFKDHLVLDSSSAASPTRVTVSDVDSGLVLRIMAQGSALTKSDVSVARTVALRVQPGRRPSLFAQPGPFIAQWDGFINSELNATVSFKCRVTGRLSMWVNDQRVFQLEESASQDAMSETVNLRSGLNRLRVRLNSLADGQASLRMQWQRNNDVYELLRPAVLTHHGADVPELASFQQLRLGRELVARLRCVRCHASSGLDEMPELQLDLPSLAGAGDRLQKAWLERWIKDPQSMRNDISMPHVLEGANEREIADIVSYVESLGGGQPVETPKVDDAGDDLTEKGLILYEDLGCIGCHHYESLDDEDPYGRTALRFVDAKYRRGALFQFLRQPHQFYRARRMPDFQLSENEAFALAAFLRDVSESLEQQLPAGDAQRGKQAFEDRGCAACHLIQTGGLLPMPTERPLSDLGDLSRGCLALDDSQRAGAPRYTWGKGEREAVIAFLNSGRESSLTNRVAAEAMERTVARLRCTTCHRRDDQLPLLPEILAEEGEQGYPADSLPPLTWTGEKLHSDWLFQLLSGDLPYNTRPWKRGRMPAFPAYARVLTDGLAAAHGVKLSEPVNPSVSRSEAAIGKRLTEQDEGFHCLQCHGLPGKPPEAPFESRGVDFHLVKDRIRPDFYRRWVGNPVQFDPAVPMPRFSPDGKSTPVKGILAGDAQRQFNAIWQYLQTLRSRSQ